jgi:hypothetical protein
MPLPSRSKKAQEMAGNTVVVKRMRPDQPGAMKWARRYGQALVCVRYRHNADRTHRWTTVELIVGHSPVAPGRRGLDETVCVRLDYDDVERRRSAVAHGASWDAKRQLWRMTRRTARALGLVDRIVGAKC